MARVKEALMDACEDVIEQAITKGVTLPVGYNADNLLVEIMDEPSSIPRGVLAIAKDDAFLGPYLAPAKGGA
jgi:hypothetical protein